MGRAATDESLLQLFFTSIASLFDSTNVATVAHNNTSRRLDQLQAGASQFEDNAAWLKRKMWWQNHKMLILLVVVISLVIIAAIAHNFGGANYQVNHGRLIRKYYPWGYV